MGSLVQADIFFFITSVAVVAVSALAVVALVYAIGVLRDVKEFSRALKEQGGLILRDVEDARRFMRSEGVKLASALGFVGRLFKGSKHARKKADDEE